MKDTREKQEGHLGKKEGYKGITGRIQGKDKKFTRERQERYKGKT